ncbi:MFS transporter [Oenococcus oeni]
MMDKKQNKTLLKIGLLSISFLLQLAGAMSVAVAAIAASYKNESTTSVQALVTIPSFAIMLFVLLDTWFVKILGKQNTVYLGLAFALVGGIGPAFINNFFLTQMLRFILGAGIGLFTPLAVSLLGDFFVGDELQNLLGIQSALSTFGSSFGSFVAGLLLGINWHATYFVYLLVVPVAALFIVGYTNKSQPNSQEKAPLPNIDEKNKMQSDNKHLPVLVIIGMLTLFVYFVALMSLLTNSALALKQLNVPNAGLLGTAMAICGLISAGFVALYGPLFKFFKHALPIIVMILAAIGMIGLANVTNMVMYTIWALLVNSSALIIPYIYGTVLNSAPKSSKNLAISIAMILNNLGAYSSPYVLAWLGKLIGRTDPVSTFIICAGILLFLTVVFIVLFFARRRSTVVHNSTQS